MKTAPEAAQDKTHEPSALLKRGRKHITMVWNEATSSWLTNPLAQYAELPGTIGVGP